MLCHLPGDAYSQGLIELVDAALYDFTPSIHTSIELTGPSDTVALAITLIQCCAFLYPLLGLLIVTVPVAAVVVLDVVVVLATV